MDRSDFIKNGENQRNNDLAWHATGRKVVGYTEPKRPAVSLDIVNILLSEREDRIEMLHMRVDGPVLWPGGRGGDEWRKDKNGPRSPLKKMREPRTKALLHNQLGACL